MDIIFEKDIKNLYIPVFRTGLKESNFLSFIEIIKNSKTDEILNSLFNLIKNSQEIIQILLDINVIYKKDGLIECLIEKYIYEKEKELKLTEFFVYISNYFQIGKNIYDTIYKEIGKLFLSLISSTNIVTKNKKELIQQKYIFENCLDLLMIFYNKNLINNTFKDIFFYLCHNEIKIIDKKDKILKINQKWITINLFLYINEYYKNEDSLIVNIKFNNWELSIKLIERQYIQIFYIESKNENFTNTELNINSWNNFQIKIKNDKAVILINGKKSFENSFSDINHITGLCFYKNFHGIVSPIIISDFDFEIKEYFSKQFIEDLYQKYMNHKKTKKRIENNVLQNYNISPIILTFLEDYNDLYHFQSNFNVIIQNNVFPFFYYYNNYDLKNNIFLLGGVKNILPLFEITYKLYLNDDDEKLKNILSKIIDLLFVIFSSDNNIEDAINSNFFEIFTLFIEKFVKYNENVLKQIIKILELLMKRKSNIDSIYLGCKEFFLDSTIIKNLSNEGKDFYLEFILNLQENRHEVFLFLLTFLINDIDEQFQNKIFHFFFHYLDIEKPEYIGEICLLLCSEELNDKIINRFLDLLIQLLNINVEQSIKENILIEQQRKILQSISLIQIQFKEEIETNNNNLNNLTNFNDNQNPQLIKDLEKQIVKKVKKFSYLIKNNLMNFVLKLADRKNIDIKIKLITLLQIIFYYYMNTNEDLSEYNQKNLLYQLEMKDRPKIENTFDQIESFDIKLTNLENSLNYQFYSQIKIFPKENIKKDDYFQKYESDFKKISNDFFDLITIAMRLNNKEEEINNLSYSNQQILFFIRDFLSLVINLHFINIESSKFNKISFSQMTYVLNVIHQKVIYPKYLDLYDSISFHKILIPLIHHIFLINQNINNELLNDIQEKIITIIFEIYLNGINDGLSNFIFFINEFDWYINDIRENRNKSENFDKKILTSFTSFFFQRLQKKMSNFESNYFQSGKQKEIEFIEQFKKEILGKKDYNIKTLFPMVKKYSKKLNNFRYFTLQLGSQNFDYLLMKLFLIYFEIFLTDSKNLDFFLDDYVILIIFCIFLCTNVIQESCSKSKKKTFFIEIILISIKSIYLYLNQNFEEKFVEIFLLFISIIIILLNSNQLECFNYYLKERNIEREFKKFINTFSKYSFDKNQNILNKKTFQDIYRSNSVDFLRYKLNIKNFTPAVRFQIIIEKIFSRESKLKFNYFKMEKKSILKKLEIEKQYRRIKKNIFSWNNSFSDKNLFYTQNGRKLLKFKVLNHYSEEMTLPILVPILNLKSFLPFSLYKCFKNNVRIYDIIGKSILDEKFENKQSENLYPQFGEESPNNLTMENIFKTLKKIKSKKKKTNIFDGFEIIETNFDFKNLQELNLLNSNFYSCCLIKPGIHITGYIILNKDNFDFIGFPRKMNDINHLYCDDNNNNICYGSLRKFNNYYYLNIKNEDILYVYKKFYGFKDDGLEIFTKQNKSYYFEFNNIGNKFLNETNNETVFPSTEIRNKIFFHLTNSNVNLSKEYESIKLRYLYKGKDKKYKNIDSICESFSKNLISKLEFLIRINLISNRSFKDINQYPIFPWIISNNYINKKLDDSSSNSSNNNFLNVELRPLNIPIGKLNKERFDSFQNKYNEVKKRFIEKYGQNVNLDFSEFSQLQNNIDIKSIPIYFENHYSKPEHVCYYLKRLFPYTISSQLLKEKNLSNKKEIFFNLEKSYINSINEKNDLKELIPELYFQPELFRNINNLNLGTINIENKEDSSYEIIKKIYNINNTNINIEGVILPFWSRNNPERYISIIREIFERPEIKINNWIDLIFGYSQKGREALNNKNIFSPYCYQGFIQLEHLNVEERKDYIKYFNKGINPVQIFTDKIKEKVIKVKKNEEDNIEKEKTYDTFLKHVNNYISSLMKKKENLIKEEEDRKKEEEEFSEIDDEINFYQKNTLANSMLKLEKRIKDGKNYLKKLKENNYKSIIYKNQFGILYNYFPGEILIFNFKENKLPTEIRKTLTKNSIYPYKLDNSEITSISIDKYFLFGTKLGSIMIYKPGGSKKNLEKIIHPHSKSIIALGQNHILNLIISSSDDGYIHIYTIPKIILVNSIFLPTLLANYVLFSFSPLPSFLIYNIEQKLFKVYSINGRIIIDKFILNVKEPKIERNKNFFEYLRINDEKNSTIYKLPYLKEMNFTDVNDDEANAKILNNDLYVNFENIDYLNELKLNYFFFQKEINQRIGTKKKNTVNKIKIK